MQRDKLKEFYLDKTLQDSWAEFIMEVLNTEALRRVYKGEDTSAIKETREIIEKSFNQLRENFKETEERVVENIAE